MSETKGNDLLLRIQRRAERLGRLADLEAPRIILEHCFTSLEKAFVELRECEGYTREEMQTPEPGPITPEEEAEFEAEEREHEAEVAEAKRRFGLTDAQWSALSFEEQFERCYAVNQDPSHV